MKAHRRGIPRLTWFKLAVCLCLAAMAVSLFTPYPAQIIRALKGEIQVAFDAQKESRVAKPQAGHFKKLGIQPTKLLKEFRVEASELPAEGAEDPGVDLFSAGQWVDVIGTSKGKGFQGAMRRHNFHGSPAAHGSMMHRRTGGVGGCSTPGRVWKNQKMPGQMGNAKRTVQNLKVVAVRPEDNVILISGAVPGARGSYLVIRPAKKK